MQLFCLILHRIDQSFSFRREAGGAVFAGRGMSGVLLTFALIEIRGDQVIGAVTYVRGNSINETSAHAKGAPQRAD